MQSNDTITYHDTVICLQIKKEFFAQSGRKNSLIREQKWAEFNVLFKR